MFASSFLILFYLLFSYETFLALIKALLSKIFTSLPYSYLYVHKKVIIQILKTMLIIALDHVSYLLFAICQSAFCPVILIVFTFNQSHSFLIINSLHCKKQTQ